MFSQNDVTHLHKEVFRLFRKGLLKSFTAALLTIMQISLRIFFYFFCLFVLAPRFWEPDPCPLLQGRVVEHRVDVGHQVEWVEVFGIPGDRLAGLVH